MLEPRLASELVLPMAAMAAGAVALWALPFRACDRCDHCRAEIERRAEKERAARHERFHYWDRHDSAATCDDNTCPGRR